MCPLQFESVKATYLNCAFLFFFGGDCIGEICILYTEHRGVASNEAEEAVASSLFCARTRARIDDII